MTRLYKTSELLSTLFVSCMIFFSFSQNDSLNQLDEKNKKQGYWIYTGKDRPELGYPMDGKIEEGSYQNDRKEGLWKRYYPNGTLKLTGHFKYGRPNGSFTKYYENGGIKEEGNFRNKHYFGVHKKYFENGVTQQMVHYDDHGIVVDTSYYFYATGELEELRIVDTMSNILTSILYEKDGAERKKTMTVNDKTQAFSLFRTYGKSNLISDNALVGTYRYTLTFKGTPIFREFLLVLREDLTFEFTKYVDESCYDYIEKCSGTYSVNNKTISFNVTDGEGEMNELIVGENELRSKPALEIDNQMRTHVFKKVISED